MNWIKYFIFTLVISLVMPTAFAAPPAPPSSFFGVAANEAAYLFWDHSSTENLLGYRLFTSSDGGATFDSGIGIVAPSGGILNSYYVADNLINGNNYIFKLSTYNSSLEESTSVSTQMVIPVDNALTDNLPPEEIGNLSAVAKDENIQLSWSHSQNTAGDLIGYRVYMKTSAGSYDTGTYIGYVNRFDYNNLLNETEYTFKVVAIDAVGNENQGIEITATPRESSGSGGIDFGGTPPSTPTFPDVKNGVFKQYIEYLAARNIITGYNDGTFRPNNNISRAESVTLLMRASGLEIDSDILIGHFTDVSPNYGLAVYIENAYSYSIISGYEDGTFKPDNKVTRAEFIKILVEVFSEKLSRVTSGFVKFSDVDKNHTFAPWVYAAYKDGLTTGYEDGTFRPDELITRAQASAMIARYFQKDDSQTFNSSLEELQALSLINASRIDEGLVPYTISGDISAVSRKHATDLGKNIKLPSYIGSDGRTPDKRLDENLVLYVSQSENVAVASYAGSTVTEALLSIHNIILQQDDNVQNQKANIFSTYKSFTHIGVGIYVDAIAEEVYMVIDFVELDS